MPHTSILGAACVHQSYSHTSLHARYSLTTELADVGYAQKTHSHSPVPTSKAAVQVDNWHCAGQRITVEVNVQLTVAHAGQAVAAVAAGGRGGGGERVSELRAVRIQRAAGGRTDGQ